MSDLPADLRGPVSLVVAVAQEALPMPAALAGGVDIEGRLVKRWSLRPWVVKHGDGPRPTRPQG